MFWRFGGYANISTIDTILDKPDFTLEELLDESDLIQELKQHNSKLIEYLRDDAVLKKLLEYVVAPKLEVFETPEDPAGDDSRSKNRLFPLSRPRATSRTTDSADNDDEELEKRRNRYALVACEVLSSDTWSIYEALTDNTQMIRDFWQFLSRPAPLDPLQASYFTKVNESLFEKKTDDMMDLLKSLPSSVPDLLRHVECPMIMDLLLKIIAMDRSEGGQGIVEWLYSKDIIPTLLSFISPEHSWVVQTAAGDFIKAIITISANASQNEQQCIGPNELTRQLVSKQCVEQLIGYMLRGGNPLTVGVGIIIEVIRKNNSDYDPDVLTEAENEPSSRDPIYLGTLLRLFADNVPKFMSLIMDGPSADKGPDSTFGAKLEPLGFDRFKTCELMAELLHCSNMGLLNEPGSEQLIASRDSERHRLRDAGILGPVHDQENSADDLTMRTTHGAPDEGRRLEITNPNEDGFEEVEPSRDANDKSGDANAGVIPIKDDDDFVDEPLSSPRLDASKDKVVEQQFENPEFVVAPLSPSKATSPELAKPETSETSVDARENSDTNEQKETSAESSSDSKTSDPAMQAVTADTSKLAVASPTDTFTRDLSPHPEDTPAPLFSSQPSLDPSVTNEPSSSQETSQETSAPAQDEATTATQGEAEITIAHVPEGQTTEVNVGEEHVVGDYLKMQFVDHRVVPVILSFFFKYPWNNFLHNVVYDIVQQVFNGPMDRGYNPTLAVSLFEAADITTAIINGQQASDESQAKTKTRMGYMGHLTLIAEEVVKFTERHPPELLSEMVLDKVMSQGWINYVEGALAETRERDNAILGGVRPEVALGHRASLGAGGLGGVGLTGLGNTSAGSAALADAGLNGGLDMNDNGGNGNDSGIGPFTITGGGMISGFGSSSDEDDDGDDVEEEDVNSEFRAYTDSLNNQGKSLDPPSIPPPPPPPPPLNIPPSRARLQLAARLAMHQKNSQSSHASKEQNNGLQDDENDYGADPFADVDENDDMDDDLHNTESQDAGRGSWWRGVIGSKASQEEDSDDEFGDFAMAEEEKNGEGDTPEKVLLRPLAVNPTKEATRGLSGLWPFGSRSESKANEGETVDEGEVVVPSMNDGEGQQAVEVKEAERRMSIEEDDEVVVSAESAQEASK